MTTTYQLEAYISIKDEIQPLLLDHYHEIALNQHAIKLNPDWQEYTRLDNAGKLRCFTARSEGELIGYFVVIVSTSLHYKDHLFASNDVIFLSKKGRKGTTGIKLIKYASKQLEDEGVSLLMVNTKVHQPFDPIMERLGFNLIERVYSKCFKR